MRAAKTVYLSLGSNVGERAENLERALLQLEDERIHILKRSSMYETAPQDVTEQPWFLNIVTECETRLFPLQLLHMVQKIERDLGRVRDAGSIRRGPRTIDIDILLFGNVRMETPGLTIPHPRMLDRRFVLEPLLEIGPDLRDPRTNEKLSGYMRNVSGQTVRKV